MASVVLEMYSVSLKQTQLICMFPALPTGLDDLSMLLQSGP